MLKLLLGTDWIANRNRIFQMLAEDVACQKNGRILIVPELISHDTERRLCAAAGDTCSRFAEVLSFSRLAGRVADSLGNAAQACLDNGGRVVAMASAARQLHSKLKAYASVETRPEFLTGLLDAVDEFKRCCISPEVLMDAAGQTEGSLAQKLEELSLLLECYNSLCARGKRDPRDQMTWLLEELEAGDFGQEHVFYIDGFPDFTRQHMQILQHLIQVSETVTISLNCDEVGSKAIAFEKAGDTAVELVRFARGMGIAVEIAHIPARQDVLLPLRNHLYQGKIDNGACSDILKTYHTDSVYSECTAAVEQVIELVTQGARYRDISIVCGDLSVYRHTLEMVFEKCGIPAYISGTEDILDKSVITTVLAGIDAALGGFERPDVMRYLKSMLSPLDLETCDALENYAVIWDINGNVWHQEWTNHPQGLADKWTNRDKEALRLLNEARKISIDPLVKLQHGLKNAANLGQQILAVYTFLEDISLNQRLSKLAGKLEGQGDNRNAQILNQLWEILLTALEQMYDVLGETAWDGENFTRLFKLLLSQYDVGTIPPVLDSVTVGPVSAMRCQQCKHLIFLGMLEGSIPGYGGSTGILTDQERTDLRNLGVPLTGGAMEGLQAEFSEIYGVFCGATETVTASYPGGQPSFIYRRLCDMAGSEQEKPTVLGAALGSHEEAGAYLVRFGARNVADELGILQTYDRICGQQEHTLGAMQRDTVRKLYGDCLQVSASQIDKQADCRLSYFLRYGLRIQEIKPATVDPAEFGTYVHAVMEQTVKEVMDAGGFRQVSMEKTLQIAKKYSQAYAMERFAQIDSQRLNYLFQRNNRELEMILRELWEEMQSCDFVPVGFEVAFGDGGEIDAIDVSGKDMPAKLRGFVDRVDHWCNDGKNYFRVVDYKTGKKDFDYCDIYNGYGLQMLLYLFALEQGGSDLLGEEPIGAGVQYFPARVPFVSADGILTDEQALAAREKLWKRKGLLLSQEHVLMAMENSDEPKRLPISKKKDGTIQGDLANRAQLAMLKTYVFSLVGKLVDEIASGCVTPNPYTRGSSHNACAFCPYGAVCHSDSVEGRRDYKAVTAQKFWEDIDKEAGKHG